MKYTLIIHGAPASCQASQTALNFARALLSQGHQIVRIFFLGDGVYTGSGLGVAPQGEQDLFLEWQRLGLAHHLDMVLCISAALKRGVLDDRESNRYQKSTGSVAPPFTLSGLGQLVDGTLLADRVITFGG